MKKYLLMSFIALCISVPTMQAQWLGGVTAGAALPLGASDNAPRLSTSFTAGIRASYLFDKLAVMVMLDGVHWIESEHPDRSAVPLDDGLYVSRALHFPVTAGLAYFCDIDRANRWMMDVYGAVGGYWHNLTCQRMAAPGVMDIMEEHGWGFACKVGFDVIYRCGQRPLLSLGISYSALGNPFATGGDPLPAGTGPIEKGIRRSQPTLSGYGQGFLNITLGYWLSFK